MKKQDRNKIKIYMKEKQAAVSHLTKQQVLKSNLEKWVLQRMLKYVQFVLNHYLNV